MIRAVLREFPIDRAPREVLEAYLQHGPSLRRQALVRLYEACGISFVRGLINRPVSDMPAKDLLFLACRWILDPQNKDQGVAICDLQCVQRVPGFFVMATKTIFFRHEHVFRDEEMLLSIIDMFEPAPRSQKRTLVALLMAHLDRLSTGSIRSMLENLEVRSIDRGRILNHLSRKDFVTADEFASLRKFYPSWKSGTLRDRQMHRRFFVQIARLRKKEREVAFARAHSPEGRRERLLKRLHQCP